jgi:Heterokaryon incompatibility protein Het-C
MAHRNYVELAMRLIGTELKDQANITPALGKVFAYVGGAASVRTAGAIAPPITTRTFGALDLYQTILGEIDDKLSAMSFARFEGAIKRSAANRGERSHRHTRRIDS